MASEKTIDKKVTIIGAGMSGLYLAHLLGRQGYQVTLIEKRCDPRLPGAKQEEARSINFTLSYRGLSALQRIGLRQKAEALAVEVKERVVHLPAGGTSRQSYGKVADSGLFSIRRKDLALLLLNALPNDNTELLFGVSSLKIDRDEAQVNLQTADGRTRTIKADFIVGADGIFSTVRPALQKGLLADFEQEYFAWVYKEFALSAAQVQSLGLNKSGVHVWPRGEYLVLALPNADGSMTCNLIMPREGERAAATLNSPFTLNAFLRQNFSDLTPVQRDIASQLSSKKDWSGIVTMKTQPWSYNDKVVLAGDSCHAVVHFYAQGLNASLEDCSLLVDLLEKYPNDRQKAFAVYEAKRKANTDLLAEMSKANFLTLSHGAAAPRYEARHRLESYLEKALPAGIWQSPYQMIAHSSLPYTEVCSRKKRQDYIWNVSGLILGEALLGFAVGVRRWLQIRKRALPTTGQTLLRERVGHDDSNYPRERADGVSIWREQRRFAGTTGDANDLGDHTRRATRGH